MMQHKRKSDGPLANSPSPRGDDGAATTKRMSAENCGMPIERWDDGIRCVSASIGDSDSACRLLLPFRLEQIGQLKEAIDTNDIDRVKSLMSRAVG